MSDDTHSNLSKNDRVHRIKTHSEPIPFIDRFIKNRRENDERMILSSIFSHKKEGFNDQFENEELDLEFETQLLSVAFNGRKRGKQDLNVVKDESKSIAQSDFGTSSSNYSLKSLSSMISRVYRIPKKPFKILDIPGLEDDYYTNLLDWSCLNKLAVCLNNKVYSHDYETEKTEEIFDAFDVEAITSLIHSPDGRDIAFGNILGQISIYDLEKKVQKITFTNHEDRIGCLDWKNTGIISGSKDKNAVFTDIRLKANKKITICTHKQEICGLKWNNQETLIASGGNDNKLNVWQFGENKRLMTGKHESGVKALAWSQKQYGVLASGGGTNDKCIKIWNCNTLNLEEERNVNAQVCSLVFSKLTNDLISALGSDLNEIKILRAKGLKSVGSMLGHECRPLHIALSPNGSILASASPDETMRFWKVFDHEKYNNEDLMPFHSKYSNLNKMSVVR